MKQRRPGPTGGYDQKRDPHARKKTKRFRDRKEDGGRANPNDKSTTKPGKYAGKPHGKPHGNSYGKSGAMSYGTARGDDGRRNEGERDMRRPAGGAARAGSAAGGIKRTRGATGTRGAKRAEAGGSKELKAGYAAKRPQGSRVSGGTKETGENTRRRSREPFPSGEGRPRRMRANGVPGRRLLPDVVTNQPELAERETAAPSFTTAGVQTVTVSADEDGMRVDRFFEARFSGLSFSHIQRIIRKGEVRVNGKRTEPKARLSSGQQVRVPPLTVEAPTPRADAPADLRDRTFLKSITLYEDDDVMVLNKPAGLAVQGGSGTTRHIDGMLGALQGQGRDAQRPRLVHRLDKDTAGCLLIAKTRFAAAALSKTFRSRAARKVYWALVYGVPKPKQGRISTFLAKQEMEEDSVMRVAGHGEDGASHAVTYYAVVETAAQQLSWLSLKPVTGRTHQLRAHMAHIRHPILGDPKYFNIENWQLPGGIQNRLHLLARRISVPHPRGGRIDVSAPLPPHMQQSWNLLGLDVTRYDPIEDAPEE